MNDNYISRAAVTAAVLWAAAIALVITTWALAAADVPRWNRPIAATAVLAMAAAVVCQMRLYTLRTCGLIRVSAGLETPDAAIARFPNRN